MSSIWRMLSFNALATEMHGWSSALAILARYGFPMKAKVAELVDALALGASGVTRGSSSLPFRTSLYLFQVINY